MEEDYTTVKSRYRKYIILGIILVLIIIVGAVLLFFLKPSKTYQELYDEKLEECTVLKGEMYYVMMAQKTGDTQYCNSLTTEKKDFCIKIATRDVSFCEEQEQPGQNICKAMILRQPDLCPQDDIFCKARASGYIKYCDQIEDDELKKECIMQASLDQEAMISDEEMQKCINEAEMYAASMS